MCFLAQMQGNVYLYFAWLKYTPMYATHLKKFLKADAGKL